MGGVGKNIRNKKKIRDALPTMVNPFRTYAMSSVTKMSVYTCANLLKQFDDVSTIRDPLNKARMSWVYEENKTDG